VYERRNNPGRPRLSLHSDISDFFIYLIPFAYPLLWRARARVRQAARRDSRRSVRSLHNKSSQGCRDRDNDRSLRNFTILISLSLSFFFYIYMSNEDSVLFSFLIKADDFSVTVLLVRSLVFGPTNLILDVTSCPASSSRTQKLRGIYGNSRRERGGRITHPRDDIPRDRVTRAERSRFKVAVSSSLSYFKCGIKQRRGFIVNLPR